MSYSAVTPNYSLRLWSGLSDIFDNADLVFNLGIIDTELAAARSANAVSKVAVLPVLTGPDQGAIYWLTAANGGFPINSIVRWDGAAWRNVGPIELQAAAPATGTAAHHNGRVVMLTADDAPNGFTAWTLIAYNGATASWQRVGSGTDVAAVLPTTGNYNGRLVVLSSGATEPTSGETFSAWDLVRWNGTLWHKIGPTSQPPEATTITPGFGVASAGKPGLLTAGATPYDFNQMSYSSNLSKWVSSSEIVSTQLGTATTTSATYADLADTDLGKPWIPWKTRDTAGIKPQFRMMAELNSDTGGITASCVLTCRSCNVASTPGAFTVFTAGAAELTVVGTSSTLRDSGWVDLPVLAVNDLLAVSAQIKTSNVANVTTVKHISIRVRWVSK